MDRRKFQGITASVGFLFIFFLCGFIFLFAAGNIIYQSDARHIGALVEMFPDQEAEIAAIFNGKINEAAETTIHNYDQYESEGTHILHKYGYTLSDSIFSGKIWICVLIIWDILAFGILLEIFLLIRGKHTTKTAIDRADFLEEKLNESHIRYVRMEKQLRQEEQNTKELITDISHQLKTPLASLKMSHELACSTELSREEQTEFVQKEREGIARLESLLNIFTRLTRLETGIVQLQTENASLKRTLTKAVSSIYMKAYEKHINISLEEFKEIQIPHDPRWTGEVFLNILDNAVKYSPSGSTVSIRVSELASYIMMEFKDQGIGIPASEAQNIFKRFYRGNSPVVKNTDGSGVGLYLARRILEQQGGTICVKARQNRGSNFVLTLPKQQISQSVHT